MNSSPLHLIHAAVWRVLFRCLFAIAAFYGTHALAQPSATFPIPSNGDAIIVSITAFDRSMPFLVDTGCSVCVFDKSLLPELGPMIAVPSDEQRRRTGVQSIHSGPAVSAGDLRIETGDQVAVGDLRGIGDAIGRPVLGVLGMRALAKHVLVFDFEEGAMSLGSNPPKWDGATFDIELIRDCPHMVLGIDGDASEDFMIDTGMIGGVSVALATDSFNRLAEESQLTILGRGGSTRLTGDRQDRVGRLRSIGNGRVRIFRPLVAEGRKQKVGLRWLARFRVALDFPAKKVYLDQRQRTTITDVYDSSGLRVSREREAVVVSDVADGSWAADCGLRKGDLVIRVDDIPVERISLYELREVIAARAMKTLSIRRSGEAFVLSVTIE